MATFEDPIALQRRLLRELRRLRAEADLTQKDVAEAMDWSPSKVIRIEAGSVTVSTTDLRALLAHYGVTDAGSVEELVTTAKGARQQPTWAEYKDVIQPSVAAYFGYEASASVIRQYEPQLIPGLLQTEEYARAVLRDAYRLPPDKIEKLVELRFRRQELLDRDQPPRLHFIVGEAATMARVGGPAVMRRQLDRLEELGARRGLRIQVQPFTLGAHPGMQGPFVLLDFPGPADDSVLYLESRSHQLTRDDPDAVGEYLDLFQGMERAATAPEALGAALMASRQSMLAGGDAAAG
jgi:transcriptional regulator with XRE-family HTH domain